MVLLYSYYLFIQCSKVTCPVICRGNQRRGNQRGRVCGARGIVQHGRQLGHGGQWGRGRQLGCGGQRGRGGQRGIRGSVTSNLTLPSGACTITVPDTSFSRACDEQFFPLRELGPHLPDDIQITPLSLFQLYFDDQMIDEILKSTISYANHKKDNLKSTYQEFMKVKLQTEEMYAFLGVLLLLGLHKVRNHRYTWSPHKAQVLVRLNQLMTCYCYEVIGTFLHIVSPEDEVAGNRLR